MQGLDDKGIYYQCRIKQDHERHLYLPQIHLLAHGVGSESSFSHHFFESQDYQAIVDLGAVLNGLIEPGAYVQRGDKQQAVTGFPQMLDWLMKEAKRGYVIQRYKGLGEMNPEQLWETTMEPQARRMLKVTIEDAIAADQIFSTLMGDDVEPRRDFIESNALQVANLDL